MRNASRLLLAATALATAATALPAPVDAIVVARVTRRGYILSDSPDEEDYGAQHACPVSANGLGLMWISHAAA